MRDRGRTKVFQCVVAVGIAVATAAASVSGARFEQKTNPGGAAGRGGFTADMAIRHAVLDATGGETRWAPPRAFRITHARKSGRWSVSLTAMSVQTAVVFGVAGSRELDNPFAVHRIEYDEDDASVRMFNVRGQRIAIPPAATNALPSSDASRQLRDEVLAQVQQAANAPLTKNTAFTGLIAAAEDAPGRRRGLEQELGAAVGRVRGLDRFLATRGDSMEEVLVDAATAVPVEINTSTRGELVRHAVLEYAPIEGAVYRRLSRSQRTMPGQSDKRFVTEIELSNVELTKDGVQ